LPSNFQIEARLRAFDGGEIVGLGAKLARPEGTREAETASQSKRLAAVKSESQPESS
jgi:hypothetical protein